MFPQKFIDQIKKHVNLLDLVREYTELQKVNQYLYQGKCPHPNHRDSSPSFRVFLKGYKTGNNINKYDTWACMGCHSGRKAVNEHNYGSDCIAFIQWIKNLSWQQAVLYLAEKYQIPIPTDKNQRLYDNNRMLAYKYIENLKGKPLQYLNDRGLSKEDCLNWGIGLTLVLVKTLKLRERP